MSHNNAKALASGDAAPLQAWRLADAAATAALGAELAALLPGNAILLLFGDLGAGKTCLVQGLALALGIHEPITSPSFALAQHYGGQRVDGSATALVHIDLYRLEDSASADELFAQEEEEAQALGATLAVEWPQRLTSPPAGSWRLEICLLDHGDPDAGRQAKLTPPSEP
jgi:tRNA threonylcarbamoyladenosine biosynthesis protein TsaE